MTLPPFDPVQVFGDDFSVFCQDKRSEALLTLNTTAMVCDDASKRGIVGETSIKRKLERIKSYGFIPLDARFAKAFITTGRGNKNLWDMVLEEHRFAARVIIFGGTILRERNGDLWVVQVERRGGWLKLSASNLEDVVGAEVAFAITRGA